MRLSHVFLFKAVFKGTMGTKKEISYSFPSWCPWFPFKQALTETQEKASHREIMRDPREMGSKLATLQGPRALRALPWRLFWRSWGRWQRPWLCFSKSWGGLAAGIDSYGFSWIFMDSHEF